MGLNFSNLKKYFTNLFYLRRVHSALGAIPVTLFVVEHMISNSFAVFGQAFYDLHVKRLTSLPYLEVIEILGIGAPIFLHAALGVYISYTAKYNAHHYRYPRNWMYVLQRVSGILLVFYISFHIWTTRLQGAFQHRFIGFQHMREQLSNPLILVFYVLGVTSAMFHFSNGLWGFCVSWGITVTPKAQRRAGWIFYSIGLVLYVMALSGLFSFRQI